MYSRKKLTWWSWSPKPVLVSCLQTTIIKQGQSRGTCSRELKTRCWRQALTHKAREPHRKGRSSGLMLLRPARCFLKARGPLCSRSHETASLLKNSIFPSSTLISLCQHQDIVGNWEKARKELATCPLTQKIHKVVATAFQPLSPSAAQLSGTLSAQQDMANRSISKPRCPVQLPALG